MLIVGNTNLTPPPTTSGLRVEREREKAPSAMPEIGRDPAPSEDIRLTEGKPATGGTYTGDITVFENFHSKVLDNDRNIYVYLPPGYNHNNNKRYPVIYMQDGQNVFNRETSFGGIEWGADETAERLIRQGRMKEVIIVAVSNTPARMNEYTHAKDPEYGGGQLDRYADFLTGELMPFINTRYKTSAASQDTAIVGSSLGGLSALCLGWKFPHAFGLVGALSPSLWWAGKDIVGRIDNDIAKKGPSKIWLDMGTRESDLDNNNNGLCDHVEYAREMGHVLLKKGYILEKDLIYFEDPGATHNEWFWSQRLEKVFLTLFGK